MDRLELWKRYQQQLCKCPGLGITLDVSRMGVDQRYWSQAETMMQPAFEAMDKLEAGGVANPDEQRMVGHYWLRAPEQAPTRELTNEVQSAIEKVVAFAKDIHQKRITPPDAGKFTDVLSIGIGGSALGPQLVADCLGVKRDKMRIHFIDNTDPDGIRRVIETLGAKLKSTLVLVISKSGGTPEPRNGMIEVKAAFDAAGLNFAKQAVAITGQGSKLDQQAHAEGWLTRFPMWDWVGGRTSVMATVGLVPAALQGIDIQAFLDGAAKMDHLTRQHDVKKNPAARLALMWHHATGGKGAKDMVVLPYKDRLILLSRYLQQLVMESLGKEHDLDGNVVNQGISVYGTKGSTDQHAYVQQLRDGVANFFATFIVVLQDTPKAPRQQAVRVEGEATSGDFLNGLWQGTREALFDKGRGSMTITLEKLNATTLGAIIALYERAVGFYATLVNINAYHQPGVEAGKKAAAEVLDLQSRIINHLRAHPEKVLTVEEIAEQIGRAQDAEAIHHVLEHLAANKRFVTRVRSSYRYHEPSGKAKPVAVA